MKPNATCLLAVLFALPTHTFAADDVDLRALRDEIANLRATYERRIDALERRLAQAESRPAPAEPIGVSASPAGGTQPTPATGANAFNPGISLILSGSYSNLSKDPSNYRITGFNIPSGPLDDMKPQRGFTLGESELGLSANIDHLFRGAMNFAIHPDNTVSAEEAFIQTTSLPQGLTLKAGRYLSGIGYHNEQHAHAWDFADAPLAYQAFLGGQFGNDGMQLRWLAPTDTYLEIGGELGRGANYPGTGRDKNGSGAAALFGHIGGDVGDSSSWRAGLSLLTTSPRDRQWDDIDVADMNVTNTFSGSSKLWILDGIWKWAPNGNASKTNFKLQGEYLYRRESGSLLYDTNWTSLGTRAGRYSASQSGWYVQGVYQFDPNWRIGLRADRLETGTIDYGLNNGNLLRPEYAPARTSLMLDFNPSEFSRFRLQLGQDRSRQGQTDNQLILQYQMSLGAHGAHKY